MSATRDRRAAAAPETAPLDIGIVRTLEDLMARAWPPLRTEEYGGWVLRASAGATRRANSVWPRGPVGDVSEALHHVEAFYEGAGLRPTFQISPIAQPAALRRVLDERGYEAGGSTDVCIADLAGVAAADIGSRSPGPLLIEDRVVPRWTEVAGAVLPSIGDHPEAVASLLAGVTQPSGYAVLTIDGVAVSCGRGVLDGDWLGIYSMATLPAARGLGAARAVLAALARWGAAGGATRTYLQVEETSVAARPLYATAGFAPIYQYVYRRRPS